MALSRTNVANLALRNLGHAKVLSNVDTDTTPEAVACQAWLDVAWEDLLRSHGHAFGFCKRVVTLDEVTTDFTDEWENACRYPADCVRFLRIISGTRTDSRSTVIPWERVKDVDLSISAITKANPAVVTTGSTAHNYAVGDEIYLRDIGGMTQLTDGWYTVNTAPTTTTFSLANSSGTAIDSSAYGTYTSGGYVRGRDLILTDEDDPDGEYVALVDIGSVDDMDVMQALAWKLSAALAPTLAKSADLSKYAEERAFYHISRAMANAANERMPDEEPNSEFLTGR